MAYMAPMANLYNPSLTYGLATYSYNGPSQALRRLATAVGAGGAVLPIDPPSNNATWTTDFSGPVIWCQDLPEAELMDVQANIADYLDIGQSECQVPPIYQAWFGKLPYGTPDSSGRTDRVHSSDYLVYNKSNLVASTVTPSSGPNFVTDLAFRIAVLPRMLGVSPGGAEGILHDSCMLPSDRDAERPLQSLAENSTFMQCTLMNSTYRLNFDYVNGNQNIGTAVLPSDNDKPVAAVPKVYSTRQEVKNCSGLNSELPETMDPEDICGIHLDVLRRMSYQALLESLVGALSGRISLAFDKLEVASEITNTVLLNTYELNFLTDYAFIKEGDTDGHMMSLQTDLLDYGMADAFGVRDPKASGESLMSLAQGIEELFRNITVSLMGSPYFRQEQSFDASSLTNVTSIAYQNVYSYSKYRLWAAYGSAIFCTVAACALGLYTISASGASYSSDFSTIFRVARGAGTDENINDKDLDGRDPLPNYLAKTKLMISSAQETTGSSSEGDPVEEQEANSAHGKPVSPTCHLLQTSAEHEMDIGTRRPSTW